MIRSILLGSEATTRTLKLGLLAVMVALLMLLVVAGRPAQADATFFVNTAADFPDANPGDGECAEASAFQACTLRAAIQEANATTAADNINFAIGLGSGTANINVGNQGHGALPTITQPVTINGYTQSGASENTATKGTNAVLKIQLNGTNAGAEANGLQIQAPNSVVRGLAINRFGGDGILVIGGGVTNVEVAGNFIGTDATGTEDRGNTRTGVVTAANDTTVGGTSPGARNLISGNGENGVLHLGGGGNTVQGNLIGTQKDGTSLLGNDLHGIAVSFSANNTFGGNAAASNTIAFNGGNGIHVSSGSGAGNNILRNSIFSNDGLGIDLNGDGPTPNDGGAADDSDIGPNGLQNKPKLTLATTSDTTTTVEGVIDSKPNTTFTVQFFSNTSGNEGKKFIGEEQVPTDGDGRVAFSFSPNKAVPVGQKITATATGSEGTSEFSAPETVT